MTAQRFAKAKTTKSARFGTFTVPAGTEVELREVFVDRNGIPTAVAYLKDRRLQMPTDYFARGTFAAWNASTLYR